MIGLVDIFIAQVNHFQQWMTRLNEDGRTTVAAVSTKVSNQHSSEQNQTILLMLNFFSI